MQKIRKIPQRQCVGCREMKDKKALLRIVKTPEGDILLDATGKKSGRGAYVCPDPECLKKARKSRALERAFDTAIPAEVYDALEGQMGALCRNTFYPHWAWPCGPAAWPWAKNR